MLSATAKVVGLVVVIDDYFAILPQEVDGVRIAVLNCHVIVTRSVRLTHAAPVNMHLLTRWSPDNLRWRTVNSPVLFDLGHGGPLARTGSGRFGKKSHSMTEVLPLSPKLCRVDGGIQG